MSNFMMNLISWVLLLLVILTLYLIDKVNQLTRLQEQRLRADPEPKPQAPAAEPPGDVLFAGLEGKKLWDAMSGKDVEGFESSQIDALRAHYEPILREHIVTTFKDGLEDAHENSEKNPGSLRTIPTPRGEVESWLPPQHLGSIYRTAMEFGGQYLKERDPEMLSRLKQTLDSVTDMLYQRAGLTNEVPFSESLLNPADHDVPALPSPQGEGATLALADASGQAEVLEGAMAQNLEHVQAYEEQQRQDLAAEVATQVIEPMGSVAAEARPA